MNAAFEFDPGAAVAHLSADVGLKRLMERVGPFAMEVRPAPSVFAALAEAIVYQQLSGKAAATIFGRLCALFPGGYNCLEAGPLLNTPDDVLRGAGISRPKLAALRDLASHAEARQLPSVDAARAMETEALVATLTRVRGVGRWTVEMFLMFRLGRADILPVDDLGVRKGLAIVRGESEPVSRAALESAGEAWRPYRTVASWYLWRALELKTPL